jgi:adenine-specific DNA-methyltransferase
VDKYIYVESFPCGDEKVNSYLSGVRRNWLKKIRKFNETNWFEWGRRGISGAVRDNVGKDCIYIYNLRKTNVAFFGEGRILRRGC